MNLKINGKVAVVAAASRGLGRAVAEAMAEGVSLAICSRSEGRILQTAAEDFQADWEPSEAARTLADWIGTDPAGPLRGIYDLQTGDTLEW